MGDSGRPASGYDMQSVAAEVHGFVEATGLAADGGIAVVGHDIGTWIGYAYAADWPGDVRRLAVMDASLPGVTPAPPAGIPSAETNLKTWHFAFNRLDDLPEVLIQGREREFLTWLFASKSTRAWRIGQAGLDEYVRVLAAPGALRAALAYYRAAFRPDVLVQSQARPGANRMASLALGVAQHVLAIRFAASRPGFVLCCCDALQWGSHSAARCLRRLSPLGSMRWALCTMRSRMTGPRVRSTACIAFSPARQRSARVAREKSNTLPGPASSSPAR